jgi:hypothetical protein
LGQLVTFSHCSIVHIAPGSHRTTHVPDPGQRTVQSPWHMTSQPPEPGHDTRLSSPTSTTHAFEPVHAILQAAPQAKSQRPDPAHCRSQSDEQSIEQSPESGHTQLAPLHSSEPPQLAPIGIANSDHTKIHRLIATS